jgi:hypothetical protein
VCDSEFLCCVTGRCLCIFVCVLVLCESKGFMCLMCFVTAVVFVCVLFVSCVTPGGLCVFIFVCVSCKIQWVCVSLSCVKVGVCVCLCFCFV